MTRLEELAQNNMITHFRDNPCRGILLGKNENNELVQISWIMGRSPNSQNRVYVLEKDSDSTIPILKTEPADASKVEDPRLIIYNAMRGHDKVNGMFSSSDGGLQIVSNGDQTDTVFNALRSEKPYHNGKTAKDYTESWVFFASLLNRYCEPDAPNFTPRITGCQSIHEPEIAYLSVLKAEPFAKEHWRITEQGSCLKQENFTNRDAYLNEIDRRAGLNRFCFPTLSDEFTRKVKPGFGYCLTTYMPGSKELPSFQGEPILVRVSGTLEEVMRSFWDKLEPEWRVSLGGKSITKEEVRYAEPINRFEKVQR
jgi:hypothetical protein